MSAFFDYIQTFYVVPDAVNAAPEVMLTSIDLFFKSKPSPNNNTSGLSQPGISVWICDVINNQPVPQRVINNSIKSVKYDFINTSGNASTSTTIKFDSGVILKSGKYYGIVIKYDDPAFNIWINRQGEYIIGPAGLTNNISAGSQSRFDGILYKSTNANDYLPLSDRDLKFKVRIAKFTSTAGNFNVVNKPYEFFTISTASGTFQGGEWVYQDVANSSGTLSIQSSSANIVGTSTTFTSYVEGQKLLVGNDILSVVNIANDTFMTVDRFPSSSNTAIGYKVPPFGTAYYTDYTKNKLYLVDSNAANSTFKFVTGTRLVGVQSGASANVASIDRYKIDNFIPKFSISNPSSSEFRVSYGFANSSNAINTTLSNMEIFKENATNNDSYVLSRSQEVVETNMFGTSKRSALMNVSFVVNTSNTNLYSVPYINANELDTFVYQNDINNTHTATRYSIADYDTEVEKNGTAKAKYISEKVTFKEGRYAESVVVYLSSYRPSGTNIKVYAKLHNSADKETFDDKQWTPLELKDNIDKYSGESETDIIEYTYGLSNAPETNFNFTGNFTVQSSNNVILADTDPSANVASGDLIKVYDPLLPDNNEVFVVSTANSSSITVNKPITNSNIYGSMYVDKLKYKNTAWNNASNFDIVRYVNTDQVEFDTYTTMQIKVVLLAENTYTVPKIEQLQAFGVSA